MQAQLPKAAGSLPSPRVALARAPCVSSRVGQAWGEQSELLFAATSDRRDCRQRGRTAAVPDPSQPAPTMPRVCGSPGCKKNDYHDGLCSLEEAADADAADAFHIRPRRPSPTKSPFFQDECVPCEEEKPLARTKKAPMLKTKLKKRRRVVDDDDDDGDSDWKPDGGDSDKEEEEEAEEEEDGDDENIDDEEDEPLSARKRGKRPVVSSSARKSGAATTTQQEPRRKPRAGGVGSKASRSRALSTSAMQVSDEAMATAVAAEVAAAADAAEAAAGDEGDEGDENDEWIDTTNHTGSYFAEYAKTGRAKCRVCGEVITLKSLRVGLECDEKGWGVITKWQHPDCTRLPRSVVASAMVGFDTLTVPDQERIEAMLLATGPPEHLKAIDPDEEVTAAASKWTTQREPPESLLAPMLPYQKEGLGWMCHQEDSDMRGARPTHPPPRTRIYTYTYIHARARSAGLARPVAPGLHPHDCSPSYAMGVHPLLLPVVAHNTLACPLCDRAMHQAAYWLTRWAWARRSRPSPSCARTWTSTVRPPTSTSSARMPQACSCAAAARSSSCL